MRVYRLDLEYFVWIRPTWPGNVNLAILWRYSKNGCGCTSTQCQAALSLHMRPGSKARYKVFQYSLICIEYRQLSVLLICPLVWSVDPSGSYWERSWQT